MSYFIGLDLGQAKDYTAISVLHQVLEEQDNQRNSIYRVGLLERFKDRPYTEVVERVKAVQDRFPRSVLVVDATGVGAAVVDMFREDGLFPVAIWIHGGDSVTGEHGTYRVPKRELAGVLQVLLQNQRLLIHSKLEHAETLKAELQNFKVKINVETGHDSYEAWREGQHDDLVLSVALAAWYAERIPIQNVGAFTTPIYRESRVSRAAQYATGFGSRDIHNRIQRW